MTEYKEFTCPKCGGHYFTSSTEKRADGSIWKTGEWCADQLNRKCDYHARREMMILGPEQTEGGAV